MPSSPSYYTGSGSGSQQKHLYNYASPQPQHFHHPGAVSPPPSNYPGMDDVNGDFPPPPPPLSTTISNMQTATSGHSFRSNPKLTANAVPRPYPGSPGAGAGSNGFTTTSASGTPTNANNYQHSFESSSIKTQNSSASAPVVPPPPPQKPTVNRNLEACVQDLHEKTFGQGGVVQLTGSNAYPGQNYEGYTSR